MSYNTKQKEAILEFFKSNEEREYTIEDLKKNLPGISQATLYRNIDSLLKRGSIKKYIIDNQSYYKTSSNCCDEHFHLVCNSCKRVIHLSCSEANHLAKHILKEHKFAIDEGKVILYGTCENCHGR